MRVVVVNPGSDLYGSDLQVLESVRALTASGVEVLVVLPDAGPLVPRLVDAGAQVEVVTFPVIRRSYLSPSGLPLLAASVARHLPGMVGTIRRRRPDVLYVNTVTIPWWLVLARALRVPSVCHVHEAEDADAGAVRRLMALPLLAARRVVFISATAQRATLQVLPALAPRSVVVLNGIPDRDMPPVPPPAGRLPRLALVSRLSARKSQHVAIAAVDLLRERGVDVVLELAGTVFPGNEGYEQRLRSEVRDRRLEGRVLFSGYVSPSSEVYDRCDIALHLSVRDALGNVVIEAQLAERPVVATGVGGHLESIVPGLTGVHVPPDDAASVAEAVQGLLSDPLSAQQMARAGRRSAVMLFGLERYGREITEVVADLGRHRPGGIRRTLAARRRQRTVDGQPVRTPGSGSGH